MYVKLHSLEEPESDDTILWRYCDLAKLLSLISSRTLFFASIRLLRETDPLEGSYSPVLSISDIKLSPKKFNDMLNIRQSLDNYVNCWYMSNYESTAMWKLYGDQYAIQTTFGQIKQAFPMNNFTAGKVQYIDKETNPLYVSLSRNLAQAHPATIHKDISFSHENEMRLILLGEHKKLFPREYEKGTIPLGVFVRVDLSALIQRVYVSPTLPAWQKELLDKVFKRYRLGHIPIERTRLDQLWNKSK